MLQATRLYLIKLLPWTIILGRRRTARGSSTMAKITPNPFTRSTIFLMAVEVEVHTGMEATTIEEMVATSMAIGTMEDSGETTPIVITMGTMDTTKAEMDRTVSTQMPRRISPTSPTTSARRMGTTPPTAQKTSQRMQPSPIRSRRDR
jgi:hypothetical protein